VQKKIEGNPSARGNVQTSDCYLGTGFLFRWGGTNVLMRWGGELDQIGKRRSRKKMGLNRGSSTMIVLDEQLAWQAVVDFPFETVTRCPRA